MRTAEIDYDIPASIPGDPVTTISVTWEIEFIQKDRDTLSIHGRALTAQAAIGGEPFTQIDIRPECGADLRDWLAMREKDLTFESIGYTEAEAWREYFEDEADRREESDQIGRAA